MINIPLDEHYSIRSDCNQFILFCDERAIEFWSDLENLIKSYFLLKIRNCNAQTISELIKIHKVLLNACNQLSTLLQKQNGVGK